MLRKTVISLVLGCASSWCGAWDLQADASTFNFVSVKKDTIGEVLHFKKLSGQIDKNGKAGITIDLNSVDTGVQIRDERMREFLFETGKYPSATYQANVDPGLHVCLPCYLGHRVAMRRVESYVERRRIAEASVVHACGADRPFQRVSCGAGGVA